MRRQTTAIKRLTERPTRSIIRRRTTTRTTRLLRVATRRLKAAMRTATTIADSEVATVVTATRMAAEMVEETTIKITSNSFAIRYDTKS